MSVQLYNPTTDELTQVAGEEFNDTVIRVSALPSASADLINETYLLVADQAGYTRGGIYQCQYVNDAFTWVLVNGSGMTVDAVEDGNMNGVTSNAVADKLLEYQTKELPSGALIEDIIPSDASASNQLVTEDNKGVGKSIARNLSSAGWYKICESGSRNQGTGFQINLGSTYHNNASCMHMIDFAYGYTSVHMSELARDAEPIFDKIRFVYVSNNERNIILVHYRMNQDNSCYATIASAYNTNKLNVFNFEAVDETQYTNYIEYNLGSNGTYEDGQKLITESDINTVTSGTATNTANVTSGICTWVKKGSVVVVTINSFTPVTYTGGDRQLATGLPKPISYTAWGCNSVDGSKNQLFSIGTNGVLMGASGSMQGGIPYYQTMTYFTND